MHVCFRAFDVIVQIVSKELNVGDGFRRKVSGEEDCGIQSVGGPTSIESRTKSDVANFVN